MAGLIAAASLAVEANDTVQIDDVVRTADGDITGYSELYRYANRVTAIVRTSDLDPGTAVTLWWRVYNRPQHCAVPFACAASDLDNPLVDGSQLHATTVVAEAADGTATAVATLYRTAARAQGGESLADTLVEGHLKGRGLRRPLNAEVEVLLASHGREADPLKDGADAAATQLTTPTGTQLDCRMPGQGAAGREYRCGVLQRVDHAAP